jgi:hypothetical protein
MNDKRKIEIFSAGCRLCEDAVVRIRALACPSCEITVLEMADPKVAARAAALGLRSVPAVAIDGKLAACCARGGIDIDELKAAGLGRALP